ncbi:MAG: anti-sigma factor antagonist, partial [Planctomycetota bacterium]
MPTDSGTIDACCQHGVVRLRVCGRAQAFQCPALRRFVEDCLAGDATELRIDLSGCEHFDSTFLGTLLHLRRTRCATGGAILTLVNPSQESLEILKRMGVKRLFNITSDLDED